MVTALKDNGRLAIRPVGKWPSRFADSCRVTILSENSVHRGTVLPLLASGHIFGDDVDRQPITWDQLEVRVDEKVSDGKDLLEVGMRVGDYVAFDPGFEICGNGFIASRHLDNKAGVAALLGAVRAVREAGVSLPLDCHPLFTIFEEVGSGASAILHRDVAEMVSIDNSTPGPGQNSTERHVTICMMDSAGPFDYHLTRQLIELAHLAEIPIRRDVFRYYRSDAASATDAGSDIRTALICFGADASHGYERTHVDSLMGVSRLVIEYLQSPPAVPRDRVELGPINGFPAQPPGPIEPGGIQAQERRSGRERRGS
jgi:peptidase M42 family hydrolase